MERFTLHTAAPFTGRVIGAGTSESRDHNHDTDYLVPANTTDTSGVRRIKCSACRWQETTIYVTDDGQFVVHTIGRSVVPGESDRHRVTFTSSAYEIVEVLTVKGNKEPFLPDPSARALAQAAAVDDDVQEAYVNRAVYR